MRYHFQSLLFIGDLAAFNQNRQQCQNLPYELLACSERVFLPPAELLDGDRLFIEQSSGEGYEYDGVIAYYDRPAEIQACLKLARYPICIKSYYVIVHPHFTAFVRKEEQLITDVERFVKSFARSERLPRHDPGYKEG